MQLIFKEHDIKVGVSDDLDHAPLTTDYHKQAPFSGAVIITLQLIRRILGHVPSERIDR